MSLELITTVIALFMLIVHTCDFVFKCLTWRWENRRSANPGMKRKSRAPRPAKKNEPAGESPKPQRESGPKRRAG